ncbi:hypothetical protein V9T40_013610 [Parthenolecanium corni]|uniref:Uncharacterized protein n=1 Tax=Parthenolecanium corni TaxID=536013 RepID=A0AAN9TBI5_9HEMI
MFLLNTNVMKLYYISQFLSKCLNFRPAVSIFVQLSQFSSRCPDFRLVVSFFVHMSKMRQLDDKWDIWTKIKTSRRKLRLDENWDIWTKIETTRRKLRHLDEK